MPERVTKPPANDVWRYAQQPAQYAPHTEQTASMTHSPVFTFRVIAIVALLVLVVGGGATVWLLMPHSEQGSMKISATASSVRSSMAANTYYANNAVDGNPTTAWVPAQNAGMGEWIRFDFDREVTLHRMIVQPGYFKSAKLWAENNRIAAITVDFPNGTSRELTLVDSMESQQFDVGSVRTKWVRFLIKSVFYGTTYKNDTALSEVTFEWER